VVPQGLVVAGAAGASLLLEIALTRIYAYSLLYHAVPLAVAGALLGVGLGGALAWWLARRLRDAGRGAPGAAGLLAAGGLAVLLLLSALPWLTRGASAVWALALASAIPFCLTSAAIALLLALKANATAALYASDLLGAAAGIVAAIGLMNVLGPPGAVVVSAGLMLLAGWWLAFSERHLARGVLVVLLVLGAAGLGLLYAPLHTQAVRPSADVSKTLGAILHNESAQAEIVYSTWDSFARTDVIATPRQPDEMGVYTDGMAGSAMYRFTGDPASVAYLRAELQYLPFDFNRPDSVLAIGPGGGEDILLALLAGSTDITAVEVNPGALDVLEHFAGFNGGLLTRPEVHFVIDDGRSFLRRGDARYDLIYLGLVTSYVSELGNLALAESYIYTVEAFQDYMQHLEPSGTLALLLHDERDTLRAVVTALVALAGEDATGPALAEAATHMALFVKGVAAPGEAADGGQPALLLISRDPWLPRGEDLLRTATARGLVPLYVPGAVEGGMIGALGTGEVGVPELVAAVDYDVTPTRDTRPFFFMFDPSLAGPMREHAVLAGATGLVTVVLTVVTGYRNPSRLRWLAVFACLGMAFAAVEVALSQSLVLLLGHPSRAFTVVLGGLLAAGAGGSWLSSRFDDGRPLRTAGRRGLVGLGGACLVYAMAAVPIQHLAVSDPALRGLAALVLLAPLGLLMGMPFPTALRLAARSERGSESTGLFWMINGLAAVVGAIGAMLAAVHYGFPAVLLGAAGLYLLAASLE
jgi:hypothetical protein